MHGLKTRATFASRMSYEQNIVADLQRTGWSALSISDTSRPFVYTVGLMFSFARPELIIFSLGDNAFKVLRLMVEEIRGGRSFAARGTHENVLGNASIATRPVHPTWHTSYLGYAMGYYRERGRIGELEAIQIFWPDRNGKFPFERGCDEAVCSAQPRLDQPMMPDERR